jgi:hypothetical protein
LPRFRIDLSAETFCRDLRNAKKIHPSIADDLAEVFAVLEDHHDYGDWIPGIGAHVRKIRVGVKQARLSKSKGFRLIYFVDLEKNAIAPLLFHYKPDLALIPPKEIVKAVRAMMERQAQGAALEGPPPDTPN